MSKLEAKNTFYNDPMYDVVVDSRMLEQHLKEKDQQIIELQKQLKSQPAEIVKKIKKEFQKHLIDWYEDEENTNSELYLDADWVWEILDTILKSCWRSYETRNVGNETNAIITINGKNYDDTKKDY